MKRPIFIGFLLFLALVACTKATDAPVEAQNLASLPDTLSPELSAIDSLMWQQPDSALSVLMDYLSCRDVSRNVSTNAYENHYAQLLAAELLYKNDYAQTNRAELQQAVAYFDTLLADTRDVSLHKIARRDASHASAPNDALVFLAARAHYINGVGYYEQDSVVQACKEYLTALETMENHFEEKELVGKRATFMALTYTHLTTLFSDCYLHEQAIYFARLSLAYYKKYDTTPWHKAWILNQIGCHYDAKEELDSAVYYYKNAAMTLNDTNIILYRDIAAHQAYLKYKKDSQLAESTIVQLHQLLLKSANEIEKTARCQYIGEVYYHERQYDSAWYYLDLVFRHSLNIESKKQAAEWLVHICKAEDRFSEIIEYTDFIVPFVNQEENRSEIKSQLTELYKNYQQTKSNREHQYEIKRRAKKTTTIIFGLFILVLSTISLYYRNRRQKKSLEAQIKVERHAHKMQQASLTGRLKRSNAALKDHAKAKTITMSIQSSQQDTVATSYLDEPICQQILTVCNNNHFKSTLPVSSYADVALSDIQKAQLKAAALRHYGQLFERIKQQYPELKEKDFVYCYLCLLGLDNVQIAVLQQKSISTIWDRENRLKRIFGSESRVSVILNGFVVA